MEPVKIGQILKTHTFSYWHKPTFQVKFIWWLVILLRKQILWFWAHNLSGKRMERKLSWNNPLQDMLPYFVALESFIKVRKFQKVSLITSLQSKNQPKNCPQNWPWNIRYRQGQLWGQFCIYFWEKWHFKRYLLNFSDF